jgi:hypothetical protein
MPENVLASNTRQHSSKLDQVPGSVALAFWPRGVYGTFVKRPFTVSNIQHTHWRNSRSSAGIPRKRLDGPSGLGQFVIVILTASRTTFRFFATAVFWSLFGDSGSFDCLNVTQFVAQQAATKPHRPQIFSPPDGVDATVPSVRELPTGQKANENSLAERRKTSLRLA